MDGDGSIISYGVKPRRLRSATRTALKGLAWLAAGAALTVGAFLVWSVIEERQLRDETARLLAANRPQAFIPTTTVVASPDGLLQLPGLGAARLAEVARPARIARARTGGPGAAALGGASVPPSVAVVINDVTSRLMCEQLGYTVVGQDADGTSVVQLWSKGPRHAPAGLCGTGSAFGGISSSSPAFRRGTMRLWRNIGAYAIRRGELPPANPAAADPPVSVLEP